MSAEYFVRPTFDLDDTDTYPDRFEDLLIQGHPDIRDLQSMRRKLEHIIADAKRRGISTYDAERFKIVLEEAADTLIEDNVDELNRVLSSGLLEVTIHVGEQSGVVTELKALGGRILPVVDGNVYGGTINAVSSTKPEH